jgi:surface protein
MVLNNNRLSNIFINASSLKKISAKNWVIPSTFENVFFRTMAGGSSIEEIDVSGWDLSNTSSISGLFAATYPNGIHLNSIIGLDTWDASNVTVMTYMFQNCEGLTTLDLSNFTSSNVIYMTGMFSGCTSLTTLDLSGFDTSRVTNMSYMFQNCTSLTTLDLSSFDTSNVTNMSNLFNGCSGLTSVNLDNFVMKSVPGGFFSGASSIKTISAKNWTIPDSFTHAFFRNMSGSSSIQSIDVTGWNLSNTTNLQGLFADGVGLRTITGLNTWDTSHVTDMIQLFSGLSRLTTLDLSSFNMTNVTNTNNMFYNCTSVTTAYARTSSDATILNNSSNKPSEWTFVVKS